MASELAFKRALHFTLAHEAPPEVARRLIEQGIAGNVRALSDDKADRGGRTAYGITQRTFDKWLASRGEASRDVWTISSGEIFALYEARYWQPCAALCPDRLAVAVFDSCVLHGKGYTIPRLQIALGLGGDGLIGPKTQAALTACAANPDREAAVLQRLLQARDDRYEELVGRDGSQVRWYRGWERRLDDLEDLLGVPRTVDPPRRAA